MDTCMTCRFYRAGYHLLDKNGRPSVKLWPWFVVPPSGQQTSRGRRGFCCRRAPEAEYGTPQTMEVEWCGEHET